MVFASFARAVGGLAEQQGLASPNPTAVVLEGDDPPSTAKQRVIRRFKKILADVFSELPNLRKSSVICESLSG